MKKIFGDFDVHITFYLLGIYMVLCGKGIAFAITVLASLAHEAAHALVARRLGYPPPAVKLLPYGASIAFEEDFKRRDGVIITAAGLGTSLTIAALFAIFSAIFKGFAPFKTVMLVNIEIFAFNVLPFYPLDGSKIIMALSKRRFKTLRQLRRMGIAASIALVAASALSILFTFNPTFGIIGIFLYVGATAGIEEEEMKGIYSVAMAQCE